MHNNQLTQKLFKIFIFSGILNSSHFNLIMFRLQLLILLLITQLAFSQSTISGSIIDGDFNEPLPFANVLIKETGEGGTTDFDGKFSIEVAPGNYTLIFSFVGYQTLEVNDIDASSGDVQDIEITMTSAAEGLEEVIVSISARNNTIESVLAIQKKSASLLDGLSSQSFKNIGASDMASAIKQVPGVSVLGGKYVYVRGLGDRYTKSILNGIDIPGLDPDRNTVQMDLFPTNILSNVQVIKSSTAELPADFTGGIVNIETKDFPSEKENSISISADYNPNYHFNNDFLSYKGGKTDFLGFDDGTRNLIVDTYRLGNNFDPRLTTNSSNLENITKLAKKFNPQMGVMKIPNAMDFSLSYSYGNQFDVGKNGKKLGILGSLSYKNRSTFNENIENNIYNKDSNSKISELEPNRIQIGNIGSSEVTLSTLFGLSLKSEKTKYKFNFLHIQNGESNAGKFRQETKFSDNIDFNKENLEYTERGITNAFLSGLHSFDQGNFKIDWVISPTFAKIHDKDFRVVSFQDEDGVYSYKENTEPKRIWRTNDESNYVSKLNFSKKYILFDNPALTKFGFYASKKQRDFTIHQFSVSSTYTSFDDWSNYNGEANNIFLESNLWNSNSKAGTYINAQASIKQDANIFNSKQFNFAGYVSNEFKINSRLRTILGGRFEKYSVRYTGSSVSLNINYDDKLIIDKFDFFPSLNFIYSLKEDTNLRFAYSKTTARPSFKEASIAEIFDPLSNIYFIGNVNIRPTYINNFDIRFESFSENAQMIALSFFYKTFTDPIELAFDAASTTNYKPLNLGDAKVYGAELEIRKKLGFISNNLDFNLNTSVINSRQTYSEDERLLRELGLREGETLSGERNLQGQSPYLINAGLNLKSKDETLNSNISYNVQGRTLEVVGDGFYPDVFTLPFNELNLNIIKKINDRQTITFKIKNLLDEKKESEFESYNQKLSTYFSKRMIGRTISLGYSLKF